MKLFSHWLSLLKLALRRDRVSIPLWVLGLAAFTICFVPAFPEIAGTAAEMATLQEMMLNPALIAMCGILYGDITYGTLYSTMMMVWLGLAFAVMNILIVARHTRADEDEGRLEVIRSLPVGRLANLLAVVKLVAIVNLILVVLIGVGMPAFGVETIDVAGSWVFAAVLGAVGLVFAGIAMLVAQIAQSWKGTVGLSLLILGVFYMMRAAGDVSNEAMSLISPLGLMERTEAFARNLWWPVLVLFVTALVLIGLAFLLNLQRDLGQGLLPQRAGRAHAPRTLAGEFGLAWRLMRLPLIAWGVCVFTFSAAYGSVMRDMEAFINSSELYQQMMGVGGLTQGDIVGPVVAMLLLIMTIIAAVPVILVALKIHSEERKGRMDQVLGTTATRTRVYLSYAVLASTTAAAMQVLNALGFASVADAMMDDPVDWGLVFKVAFNYLPALLAFAGLGLFLVGWVKRLTAAVWVYLVATFLLVYMGGMLDVPRWATRLTPLGFLNRWPVEDFEPWRWMVLLAVAVVLGVVGWIGFNRRDVSA